MMKTGIEDELRDLLGGDASEFRMDGAIPSNVTHRARRRALRTTSVLVAAAVAAGVVSISTVRNHHGSTTPITAGSRHGKVVVNLVDYVDQHDGQTSQDDGAGL